MSDHIKMTILRTLTSNATNLQLSFLWNFFFLREVKSTIFHRNLKTFFLHDNGSSISKENLAIYRYIYPHTNDERVAHQFFKYFKIVNSLWFSEKEI